MSFMRAVLVWPALGKLRLGPSCPTYKVLVGFPLSCGLLCGVPDQDPIGLDSGCLGGWFVCFNGSWAGD